MDRRFILGCLAMLALMSSIGCGGRLRDRWCDRDRDDDYYRDRYYRDRGGYCPPGCAPACPPGCAPSGYTPAGGFYPAPGCN